MRKYTSYCPKICDSVIFHLYSTLLSSPYTLETQKATWQFTSVPNFQNVWVYTATHSLYEEPLVRNLPVPLISMHHQSIAISGRKSCGTCLSSCAWITSCSELKFYAYFIPSGHHWMHSTISRQHGHLILSLHFFFLFRDPMYICSHNTQPHKFALLREGYLPTGRRESMRS